MHSKVVIFLTIAAYALVLMMPQGEGADATTAENCTLNGTKLDTGPKLLFLHFCIKNQKDDYEMGHLTAKGFKVYKSEKRFPDENKRM